MYEREIRPGDYMVDTDDHLWRVLRVLRVGADTRRGCPECDSDGEAERHPQADAERASAKGVGVRHDQRGAIRRI